jgi:biotin-dependent carboxylase-like uncharacterized protein
MALRVVDPGLASTVQDDGRPGCGMWGVAGAGAADKTAWRRANRLVGNGPFAALEVLMGGLQIETDRAVVIAVCGAPCGVFVNGMTAVSDSALLLAPGDVLGLGHAPVGRYAYVAVRGGVAVDTVLGSRSFDTLGRIGPPPLSSGMSIAIGAADDLPGPWFERVPVRPVDTSPTLWVSAGPRHDWVHAADLYAQQWRVSDYCDRVGVRLAGRPVPWAAAFVGRDLPSEPMLPGAVQVPPDGQPIILGPDGGVTGGYPVVAVLDEAGADLVAQLRPGDTLRFSRH